MASAGMGSWIGLKLPVKTSAMFAAMSGLHDPDGGHDIRQVVIVGPSKASGASAAISVTRGGQSTPARKAPRRARRLAVGCLVSPQQATAPGSPPARRAVSETDVRGIRLAHRQRVSPHHRAKGITPPASLSAAYGASASGCCADCHAVNLRLSTQLPACIRAGVKATVLRVAFSRP